MTAQVRDALGLLNKRSPGDRVSGELTDTKSKRHRLIATSRPGSKPTERALGKIFPPSAGVASPEEWLDSLPSELFVGEPLGLDALPLSELGRSTSNFPAANAGSMPRGFGPISSLGEVGTPDGALPDVGETPIAPPSAIVPPSAVPEPGTWFMMIIGFGFCSLMLRRGRSRQLDARLAQSAAS
jgi:hypothetical protein